MGYLTSFQLKMDPVRVNDGRIEESEFWPEKTAEMLNTLIYGGVPEEFNKYAESKDQWWLFALSKFDTYGGPTVDDVLSYYGSWGEWEKDLLDLSKYFPDVLFTLLCYGEDPEDFWISYFLDGVTQYCPGRIVYTPMDPDFLLKKEGSDK